MERENATNSAVSLDQIKPGMDVLDASGDVIGTVARVDQPTGAMTGASTGSPLATSATTPQGGDGFLEVQTSGIFGSGAVNAKSLWIPLELVRHINPDENRLTVDLTKIDAETKYDKHPVMPGYGL